METYIHHTTHLHNLSARQWIHNTKVLHVFQIKEIGSRQVFWKKQHIPDHGGETKQNFRSIPNL